MTDDLLKERYCSIHNQPLREGEAVLRYGPFRLSAEYCSARDSLFPNANFFKLAERRLDRTEEIKIVRILFCEVCRKAEEEWQKVTGSEA